MASTFSETASGLRQELGTGTIQSLTALAELASRHANNRELAHRAVLLRIELTRTQQPPTADQIQRAVRLLDELREDQRRVADGPETRGVRAEAARARALEVAPPSEVVLSCNGLGATYRRGAFALKDVAFELRYGEVLGIVGRNGNGKTTLFRILVGELSPTTGELRYPTIAGGVLQWSRIRGQIAYVPQDLPAWSGSLQSNLHYEAAFHGLLGADNEREVAFIIERLDLASQLDKRWNELSGGYKLRFALARALVWRPKLLILDEPLANLDVLSQQVVLGDLRHLTDSLRYPLAVLVTSQHIHEIEEVSDKLLLLSAGQQKYFGASGCIGADRRTNRFEVSGEFELPELQAALDAPEYASVHYNGVSFVVLAALDVTPSVLLRRLIDQKLRITYFRDISRSAKSLLQEDGRAA